MKEKIVSKAYAKAMSELASQENIDIAKEMTELSELINKCNDLENVLFLQLFSNKEKTDVLNELFNKSNLSDLLKNFLAFLIDEGRIGLFPLIFALPPEIKEETIIFPAPTFVENVVIPSNVFSP